MCAASLRAMLRCSAGHFHHVHWGNLKGSDLMCYVAIAGDLWFRGVKFRGLACVGGSLCDDLWHRWCIRILAGCEVGRHIEDRGRERPIPCLYLRSYSLLVWIVMNVAIGFSFACMYCSYIILRK